MKNKQAPTKQPTRSGLPPGKVQMGIIITPTTHYKAKELTAALSRRLNRIVKISDVYTMGIDRLYEDEQSGRGEPIVPEGLEKYMKGLSRFLSSTPNEKMLGVLESMIGEHMPKEK